MRQDQYYCVSVVINIVFNRLLVHGLKYTLNAAKQIVMTADSLNNLFVFVKPECRSAACLHTFLNYPACKSHHVTSCYIEIGLFGYDVFLVIITQKARLSAKNALDIKCFLIFLYKSR